MVIPNVKTERGATLLEAAVALPVLFLCLIVTIELLRVSYVQLSMQFVITDVVRLATINPMTDAELTTVVYDRLQPFGISFDSTSDTLTICPTTDTTCATGTINPGNREDFMRFTLTKAVDLLFVPVMFPGIVSEANFTLSAQAVGRNEPA